MAGTMDDRFYLVYTRRGREGNTHIRCRRNLSLQTVQRNYDVAHMERRENTEIKLKFP